MARKKAQKPKPEPVMEAAFKAIRDAYDRGYINGRSEIINRIGELLASMEEEVKE